MTGAAWIDVWHERDGLWRWRYRQDDGVELLSNEGYLTKDQAVHAASVAYPGVRIEILTPSEGDHRPRGGLAALFGQAVLLLVAAVAAVPLALVRVWRHLRRLLRRSRT